MSNNIYFYEPNPIAVGAAPKAVVIDLNASSKRFKKQFVASSTPHIPLPVPNLPITQAVIAGLLNIGYGANAGELGLLLKKTEWAALQEYLKLRLKSILALLPQDAATPPNTLRSPAIPYLESTEKIHMAFVLGGVFCYLGTNEWVKKVKLANNGILRFWHRSVAASTAVQLTQTVNSSSLNPDYLVETSFGWCSVEAKGSFNAESWTYLRDGLKQAAKIDVIEFFDLTTKPALNCNAMIADFLCAHTWFSEVDKHLNVTVLDLPKKEPLYAIDLRGEVASPIIIKEFADLVRSQQACAQFKAFTTEHEVLPDWVAELQKICWRKIFQLTSMEPVYLGIPTTLLNVHSAIALAVDFLNLLVPACGRSRELESVIKFGAVSKDLKKYFEIWKGLSAEFRKRRKSTDDNFLDAEFWTSAQTILIRLRRKRHEYGIWSMALSQFPDELTIPAHNGSSSNIITLCQEVRRIAERACFATRLEAAEKQINSGDEGLKMLSTDHGLLIAAGPWRPRNKRLTERLSKI